MRPGTIDRFGFIGDKVEEMSGNGSEAVMVRLGDTELDWFLEKHLQLNLRLCKGQECKNGMLPRKETSMTEKNYSWKV